MKKNKKNYMQFSFVHRYDFSFFSLKNVNNTFGNNNGNRIRFVGRNKKKSHTE